MAKFTISVNDEMFKKLEERSKQLGIARSTIITLALEKYFQEQDLLKSLPGLIEIASKAQEMQKQLKKMK